LKGKLTLDSQNHIERQSFYLGVQGYGAGWFAMSMIEWLASNNKRAPT
jgi:hypothetical protein